MTGWCSRSPCIAKTMQTTARQSSQQDAGRSATMAPSRWRRQQLSLTAQVSAHLIVIANYQDDTHMHHLGSPQLAVRRLMTPRRQANTFRLTVPFKTNSGMDQNAAAHACQDATSSSIPCMHAFRTRIQLTKQPSISETTNGIVARIRSSCP